MFSPFGELLQLELDPTAAHKQPRRESFIEQCEPGNQAEVKGQTDSSVMGLLQSRQGQINKDSGQEEALGGKA